jgi:hypothetical protein
MADQLSLGVAITRAVADFMHYFYEVELDEQRKQKLRDDWIEPTLEEHAQTR